jgi:hypothetical protein
LATPRFTRTLFLALWSASFLAWLLIIVWAIVDSECWCEPIIEGNPVPDWLSAALFFVFSFVCLVVYLTYWDFPDMPRGKR